MAISQTKTNTNSMMTNFIQEFNFAFNEMGMYSNETHVFNFFPYTQVYQQYPILEPFYTHFEKTYDAWPICTLMQRNNYVLPITSCVVYLLFCYFGQIYMNDHKAFDLRYPLAVWNLFLSVFSCYGAFRTLPHLLYRLATVSFEDTVCEPAYVAYGAGASGLATQLFILSKIPELIDTVFIVLRKKPLIFLHWYHHVTVLLYCWNSYVTVSSAGIYFVAMNYSVHAIMYFYYFLQAIKSIPPWFPSWMITLAQISQMFIGTFIVGTSLYFHFQGGEKYAPGQCNNAVSTLFAGFVMYSSYLYLFVEFAVKRFLLGGGRAMKKQEGKKEKSLKCLFPLMFSKQKAE